MSLWILGARGLLGSTLKHMAKTAVGTGHEVDLSDLRQLQDFVEKNPGITHIANCAAFSLVDLSETSHREEAFLANAKGPENLGVLAKERGIKLVHISTDYVFGGKGKRPLLETDPTGPCNYYGQTKLEGEERLKAVNQDACIIRTSWIFGNGGKNFVASLLNWMQQKEEISLTDDQWGRPTYAFDLARAILEMFDHSGTYHFANAGASTKYIFGCALLEEAKKLGIPLTVQKLYAMPGRTFASPCKRPAYSVFDTSKIETILSFPIRTWQETLREYLCTLVPSTVS